MVKLHADGREILIDADKVTEVRAGWSDNFMRMIAPDVLMPNGSTIYYANGDESWIQSVDELIDDVMRLLNRKAAKRKVKP